MTHSSPPESSQRVVVVGAGVVGLACARLLARRGFEVLILESGPRIAEGVTSRNSGVIHSPLNYPPGSLKSSLCSRGRELLYSWCAKAEVPHRQTGKLIVSTNTAEETELEKIYAVAHQSGAPEVTIMGRAELQKLEPSSGGTAALYSPKTGIIDPYELSRSFLRDAEDYGAMLVTRANVTAVDCVAKGFELQTSAGPIEAQWVINSAGLYADEIARLAGIEKYQIYPWRGDYFTFRPGKIFSRLIYPVKMKSDPGLGVHLTIDLQGRYRLGPDVELVQSREDFTARESKLEKFLLAARKLFPWATAEMLQYDTCGIRPKLRGPSDTAEKDFVIARDLPGWVNLIGIESPGLTASMAIAERVSDLVQPDVC